MKINLPEMYILELYPGIEVGKLNVQEDHVHIVVVILPILMAVILGPIIESNFGRSLLISGGSYSIFFASTLSKILLFLIILALALPFLRGIFKKIIRDNNKII